MTFLCLLPSLPFLPSFLLSTMQADSFSSSLSLPYTANRQILLQIRHPCHQLSTRPRSKRQGERTSFDQSHPRSGGPTTRSRHGCQDPHCCFQSSQTVSGLRFYAFDAYEGSRKKGREGGRTRSLTPFWFPLPSLASSRLSDPSTRSSTKEDPRTFCRRLFRSR